VGIAHFDPRQPAGIDELLDEAKRDMNQPSGPATSLAGLGVARC
jgi:hypothetical protein